MQKYFYYIIKIYPKKSFKNLIFFQKSVNFFYKKEYNALVRIISQEITPMITKELKNKKLIIVITSVVVVLLLLVILFFSLFNINIIVNGKENETIEYGDTYTEEGASASYNTLSFKNKSVDVSISGEVDCSKLGTYHIHYKAKKGFLSSTKTREVKVVDTAAPVIELNTVEGYYPKTGEAYKEEGFTATDNYDGDITDKVTRHERIMSLLTLSATPLAIRQLLQELLNIMTELLLHSHSMVTAM